MLATGVLVSDAGSLGGELKFLFLASLLPCILPAGLKSRLGIDGQKASLNLNALSTSPESWPLQICPHGQCQQKWHFKTTITFYLLECFSDEFCDLLAG